MAVLDVMEMTSEEVATRADEIYARRFQKLLESEHRGEFLALDILSEEYELGRDKFETVEKLRARLKKHRIVILRVGYEAADEIGALTQRLDALFL
jgi:hypothetical protein